MSHSRERKEKVCLNCTAELHGRYCHVCGQENTEPKETVWHLIAHFFYDITHFDGKFFSSLKYLAFRPGFLSKEYIQGRRASYLNPIRFYVFTSALFFIIFFSVTGLDHAVDVNLDEAKKDSAANKTRSATIASALKGAETKQDSADILNALKLAGVDTGDAKIKDSIGKVETIRTKKKGGWRYAMNKYNFTNVSQYDSMQKTLPEAERDGWLARQIKRRSIELNIKYGNDGDTLVQAWFNAFFHQFPKLLFVSLPIFALILRLLYIRRRKQFFYVDHSIFSIHLYIFSFIVLLVSMALAGLGKATGWDWLNWLQAPLWIYLIYYDYKALRNFYGQSRWKTIVKFILLNTMALICIVFLFAVFFIVAAYQL